MKKSIMVCVDLNDNSLNLFKEDLKTWDLQAVKEVHFVHGFQSQHYADAFYFNIYPPENDYGDIEKSVQEVLKPLEDIVKEANSEIQVVRKCIIVISPKGSLCDYAKDKNIDSMVIGTRVKHGIAGLFSSSFTEYMVRHAPCELRIIRGN
jgi:nucleotide-binding universal stress UspA family protein